MATPKKISKKVITISGKVPFVVIGAAEYQKLKKNSELWEKWEFNPQGEGVKAFQNMASKFAMNCNFSVKSTDGPPVVTAKRFLRDFFEDISKSDFSNCGKLKDVFLESVKE